MPFMDEPPGARVSAAAISVYGAAVRSLRSITHRTVNKEPKWRQPGRKLTTGYQPRALLAHSQSDSRKELISWQQLQTPLFPARVRNAAWLR